MFQIPRFNSRMGLLRVILSSRFLLALSGYDFNMELSMSFRFMSCVLLYPVAACSLFLSLEGGLCPTPLAAQRPSYETSPEGVQATRFVSDLLQKMTLEEKLGQMSQIPLNQTESVTPDERILKEQVGSFLFITDAKEINRLQHLAV